MIDLLQYIRVVFCFKLSCRPNLLTRFDRCVIVEKQVITFQQSHLYRALTVALLEYRSTWNTASYCNLRTNSKVWSTYSTSLVTLRSSLWSIRYHINGGDVRISYGQYISTDIKSVRTNLHKWWRLKWF